MIYSMILKLAIWLTLSGFYSEGLAVFNAFPNMDRAGNPRQYFEYHYFRACCAFSAREKDMVKESTKYIIESINPQDCPRRYLLLAQKLNDEVSLWKNDDLPDIIRDMKDVAQRLDNLNGGKYTQKNQEGIIKKLDKHIKQLEDEQQKNKDGQANSKKDTDSKTNKSQKPADESKPSGGEGKGEVDQKKLANYAQNWGNLPPLERQKAVTEMTRDLPAKHRQMVEDYFKALNRSK